MRRKRVLFVGDATHHEFAEPLAWLGEYCDLTISADCDAALADLQDARNPPDVIVVAAARPGQFAQRHVAVLMRRAPLARCIGLMGGWCEGELRTGQPWRGVTRVYWHQFVPRLAEELTGVNARGRLAMPRTFTEAEFSGISTPPPEITPCGLIVIHATSLASYAALADACLAIGHSTVWERPQQPSFTTGAKAAIWDVPASVESVREPLEQFAQRMRPAPVLALIGFPRESDRQLALACGATAVVSKPYLLQELWTELARATSPCSTSTARTAAA